MSDKELPPISDDAQAKERRAQGFEPIGDVLKRVLARWESARRETE